MSLLDEVAERPAPVQGDGNGDSPLLGLSLVLAALALTLGIYVTVRSPPQLATSPSVVRDEAAMTPVGSVVAFAGSSMQLPVGWLPCDGRELNRTEYEAAFAAIGTTHGTGDGMTTFFLPDYRGLFLRGVDGQAGRDPDVTTRVPAQPGGASGNAVGSIQADAFAQHRHNYSRFRLKDVDWKRGVNHFKNGTGDLADVASTTAIGGSENRPKNAYVLWIIRVR